MKKIALLMAVVLLGGCATKQPSASSKVGWKWLIQYSYLQSTKEKDVVKIHVQMYDNGRVEYIRADEFLVGNAAWWRKLRKTPKEVESVRRQIEVILAGLKDDSQQSTRLSRALQAGIIIRTAEELVNAWGNDMYGDPHKQEQMVFKNWRDLDDDAHIKIQKVMKQFNDEAEKFPWKRE